MEYFKYKIYDILLYLNVNNINIKIFNKYTNDKYENYIYCKNITDTYNNIKLNLLKNSDFIYENIFHNMVMILNGELYVLNKNISNSIKMSNTNLILNNSIDELDKLVDKINIKL